MRGSHPEIFTVNEIFYNLEKITHMIFLYNQKIFTVTKFNKFQYKTIKFYKNFTKKLTLFYIKELFTR